MSNRPNQTTPAYVIVDHDSDMPRADRPGTPGRSIWLEMTAYDAGDDIVGSLSEIEFYRDESDWVCGKFFSIYQIPERCDHLREVARELGLPEHIGPHTFERAKYGCPQGHTQGLQASYRVWVWVPVNTLSGEDRVICENNEIELDDESFEPVGEYWCPTCGDTFKTLKEIE